MNMPDFANRLLAGPPRVCCPACDKEMGLKPPALGDNVKHETCRRHLTMMRAEALRLRNIYAAHYGPLQKRGVDHGPCDCQGQAGRGKGEI